MFSGAAVVMGVASCGKTTVGEKLALRLHAAFHEGDRLHSPASVEKMSKGIALADDDRWPWLQRVGESLKGPGAAIASCSALKKIYRQHIAMHAGRPVSFVHLHGSRELLALRISARKGHFMPPSLLDSQLATLEMPGSGEIFITVDMSSPVDEQVEKAAAFLENLASA
jgi:gluconokinase